MSKTVLQTQVRPSFRWREIGQRPQLPIRIVPVDRSWWPMFRPYHYMAAGLHRSSRCFLLCVADVPTVFAAVLNQLMPPSHRPLRRVSRIVTLPDWQGLGLAFVLLDALGGAYAAHGIQLRLVTANWIFATKLAGHFRWSCISHFRIRRRAGPAHVVHGWFGGRCTSCWAYIGPADISAALALLQPGVAANCATGSTPPSQTRM